MNEFTTIFLFTDVGDYQTRVAAWTTTIVAIPVVYLLLFVLLNLRIPQPPNGKVYIRNTSFHTINLLGALITILLGSTVLIAIVIFLAGPDPGHIDRWTPSIFVNDDSIFGNPEYSDLQKKYNSHQYFVTEGTVHVLHVQPFEGYDAGDIIKIGDVELEVNFFRPTFGYHRTISRGGALTEGTYARIFYVENPPDLLWVGKHTILRVDIKDK